jgi:hypothetical protein
MAKMLKNKSAPEGIKSDFSLVPPKNSANTGYYPILKTVILF